MARDGFSFLRLGRVNGGASKRPSDDPADESFRSARGRHASVVEVGAPPEGADSELGPRATPLPKDRYSASPLSAFAALDSQRASPSEMASPHAILRPVAELVPDLTPLTRVTDVAARFQSDVTLLRDQLVPGVKPDASPPDVLPGLDRIYELFVSYAEHFVALAVRDAEGGHLASEQEGRDGPNRAPSNFGRTDVLEPLTEREEGMAAFTQVLEALGMEALEDPRTGQTALEAAKRLLSAPSLEAFDQRVNAFEPEWAVPAPALQGNSAAPTLEPHARPWIPLPGAADLRGEPGSSGAFTARGPRWTQKVLGPRMLWNVLHHLRGEGEDSVQARDAFNRLAFIALGVLVGVMVLVLLLVQL